jgi:hypothetical protein
MAAFVAVELTGDWQLLPLLLAVDTFGWLVARMHKGRRRRIVSDGACCGRGEG